MKLRTWLILQVFLLPCWSANSFKRKLREAEGFICSVDFSYWTCAIDLCVTKSREGVECTDFYDKAFSDDLSERKEKYLLALCEILPYIFWSELSFLNWTCSLFTNEKNIN